jgi:DNA-binding response OmpR family regulator
MKVMTELNVLAIGNEKKFRKITACVTHGNIKISAVTKLSEAVSKLQIEAFDLIIVDSSFEQFESVCQYFYENFRIPVILLVYGNNPHWSDYCSLKVDGFLCEESSNTELIARIKASARRKI